MPRAIPNGRLGEGFAEALMEDPLPLPPLGGVPREVLRAGELDAGAEALSTGFTSTVAFAAAEVGVAALFVGVDAAESALERRRGEGVAIGWIGLRWDGEQNVN